MINFEEFKKVELKVVKVLEASRVEGSEKLLKLIVDLGEDSLVVSGQAPSTDSTGSPQADSANSPQADSANSPQAGSLAGQAGQVKRQIIAGIGKAYEPESLIGKEIVIVANLEPRMLMGLESQGMVLAASNDGGPVILMPEKEVPPGSLVG